MLRVAANWRSDGREEPGWLRFLLSFIITAVSRHIFPDRHKTNRLSWTSIGRRNFWHTWVKAKAEILLKNQRSRVFVSPKALMTWSDWILKISFLFVSCPDRFRCQNRENEVRYDCKLTSTNEASRRHHRWWIITGILIAWRNVYNETLESTARAKCSLCRLSAL